MEHRSAFVTVITSIALGVMSPASGLPWVHALMWLNQTAPIFQVLGGTRRENRAKSMLHKIAIKMNSCAEPVVRLARREAAHLQSTSWQKKVVRMSRSTGAPLIGTVHGSKTATAVHTSFMMSCWRHAESPASFADSERGGWQVGRASLQYLKAGKSTELHPEKLKH